MDVNRLVTGMSELLRRTLGESVAIETVLGGGLWQIFADPNQLENSILNLAVNARDDMPDGGKLTIETANAHLDKSYASEHQEVQPGQYVMVALSDTGTGMTKEVAEFGLRSVFHNQGGGARHRPRPQPGLRLRQANEWSRQDLQRAWRGNDHTHLSTPLGRRRFRHKEEALSRSAPSGDGSETILLVEDDEAVRELNAWMLRELNYAVIEAEDGAKALQILEANPTVRVLFTDVGLPRGMNGRQLAGAALRLRPNLRVLFTTGYARNAIVHHGRLNSGIDLISKPFTAAALAVKNSRAPRQAVTVAGNEGLPKKEARMRGPVWGICGRWRRWRSGHPVLIVSAFGGAERRAADRRLPSSRASPVSSASPHPESCRKGML